MRVFMVYWTLCDVDNFSDFDNVDWGEPTEKLRSDRYRAWDFNDNAAVYDCVYTVAEYYI